MSYPATWSHRFAQTEWKPISIVDSGPCIKHQNKECMMMSVTGNLPLPPGSGHGEYNLKDPIDIKNIMPGTGHKVTILSYEALVIPSQFFHFWANEFDLLGDTAQLAQVLDPIHGTNVWNPVNIISKGAPLDISQCTYLDLFLYHAGISEYGTLELHESNFYVEIDYLSDLAPTFGNIQLYVYDRQTSAPISGIVCQVTRSNNIVQSITTNPLGIATFTNLESGGYMCNVLGIAPTVITGGYDHFSQSVTVIGNTTVQANAGLNALEPIPPPIPWWAIGAGIGGVGLLLGYEVLKGRKSPINIYTK